MWQKVAKFKGAEYFRKALYLMTLLLIKWKIYPPSSDHTWLLWTQACLQCIGFYEVSSSLVGCCGFFDPGFYGHVSTLLGDMLLELLLKGGGWFLDNPPHGALPVLGGVTQLEGDRIWCQDEQWAQPSIFSHCLCYLGQNCAEACMVRTLCLCHLHRWPCVALLMLLNDNGLGNDL